MAKALEALEKREKKLQDASAEKDASLQNRLKALESELEAKWRQKETDLLKQLTAERFGTSLVIRD